MYASSSAVYNASDPSPAPETGGTEPVDPLRRLEARRRGHRAGLPRRRRRAVDRAAALRRLRPRPRPGDDVRPDGGHARRGPRRGRRTSASPASAQYDYAPDVARAAVTAAHSAAGGAAVYNAPGALADVADIVAAIQESVPEAEITWSGDPLPFPPELEAVGFDRDVGPFPRTPLADGRRGDDRALPAALAADDRLTAGRRAATDAAASGRGARRTAPPGSPQRARARRRTSPSRPARRRGRTARSRRSCSRGRASSRRARRRAPGVRSKSSGSVITSANSPPWAMPASERPGVRDPRERDEHDGAGDEAHAEAEQERAPPAGAVGEPRDDERGRDRRQVHHREQQPRAAVAPAALGVRVGEPGVEAVVRGRHRARRSRRGARRCRCATAAAAPTRRARCAAPRPSVSTTQATSEQQRDARDRDQGAAPAVEPAGERDRERRRAGRADLDAGRVDARARRRPLSKCSLTEIGASALPSPIPMPTGQVRSTTSQADGIVARSTPKTPISASPIVIARRVPIRAAR